jgi:hypothetical protein
MSFTPANSNVTDLASARRTWDASMAWEPGQRFLDPERTSAQDRALAAYTAAKIAAETPQDRIARLHREAADLDARADDCIREGAKFAGDAAMRRLRFGDDEGFAAILQHKAEARDRLAIKYGDEAFGLKLEAAGIIAQEDLKAHLTGAVRSIGGRS